MRWKWDSQQYNQVLKFTLWVGILLKGPGIRQNCRQKILESSNQNCQTKSPQTWNQIMVRQFMKKSRDYMGGSWKWKSRRSGKMKCQINGNWGWRKARVCQQEIKRGFWISALFCEELSQNLSKSINTEPGGTQRGKGAWRDELQSCRNCQGRLRK